MAGLLSPEIRERIRAASDIVDVIGGYVPLKRAGANFTALCPFHQEKSPSFNVNPQRQIFHCFGCHKGGDVFTFVQAYENLGFMEALRRLADRARIPLELTATPAEAATRRIKEELFKLHDALARHWQTVLAKDPAGQPARDYLRLRGVSAEAVELFRLGAAPEAWDDTVAWGARHGYPPDLLEQGGLVVRKEDSQRVYDRFRGRLMFPICDETGRVAAFSGRLLSPEAKAAKYVNSPETPIFSKGKILFGLDKSKRAILDANQAIVCEGQLDLIACFMNGVKNVIAPQGTAFTEQHARILKRHASEAVLCFDADKAGQAAAVRSLDHLLAAGLAVRVVRIPPPHDPDSFIKQAGGGPFLELVRQAPGFFDYYLDQLCAQHEPGSDKGRLLIVGAMASAVYKTGNGVLIDAYAQKTALRLGVSPAAVRAEFAKASAAGSAGALAGPEPAEAGLVEMVRPPPNEFHLLKLLLQHEELAASAAGRLEAAWIQHPLLRAIVSRRLEACQPGVWTGLAPFLADCASDEERGLITEAATEERKIPNPEIQVADLLLKLRNQFYDQEIAALALRLGQPGLADDARLELLRQYQQLREKKRRPLTPVTA